MPVCELNEWPYYLLKTTFISGTHCGQFCFDIFMITRSLTEQLVERHIIAMQFPYFYIRLQVLKKCVKIQLNVHFTLWQVSACFCIFLEVLDNENEICQWYLKCSVLFVSYVTCSAQFHILSGSKKRTI